MRPADDGGTDASGASAAGPVSRRRRTLCALLIAVVVIAGLVVASAATSALIESAERSAIPAYGQRVHIGAGDVNVTRSGAGGSTIVFLSGLGTIAPALDYAPLIAELDDDFTVLVVEGLGYGFSDLTAPPRTVENITAELHETLAALDIEPPYALAGHSVAGYYTLFYALEYPDEASAVIGIDATVPTDAAAEHDAAPAGGVNWAGLARRSGLVRWVTMIAPGLAVSDSDALTDEQIEQMRALVNWTFGNDAVFDETDRIAQNGRTVLPMRYPDDLPVLNFLATGKATWSDELYQRNRERLSDVPGHEIVLLDGDHYLHHTHARDMAEAITDFLGPEG